MTKIDFDRYKREISLPDFLLKKLGWEFTVGSSASAPKMTDGNTTIVIKRNRSGQYTYWDVHDQAIRGRTIIDIMQQHIFEETGKTPSLREVGIILQGYMDKNEIVLTEESNYKVSNTNLDTDALSHLQNQLRPYKGDFLQKRGIKSDILSTNTFCNTFFSRTYRRDEYVYCNTCVKMINQKGFQGISQRNEHFKGILGSHFDSIAASNWNNCIPIEIMYVGESMIDCASHYQLNHFNTDKNLLYISTEGTLTQGQIELIRLIIQKNTVNKMVTIFDNDKQGYIFACQLITSLKNQEIKHEEVKNFDQKYLLCLTDHYYQVELSNSKDWNDELKDNS